MTIYDLEDDVKMELGFIGEHVEYNLGRRMYADEVERMFQIGNPEWYPGTAYSPMFVRY